MTALEKTMVFLRTSNWTCQVKVVSVASVFSISGRCAIIKRYSFSWCLDGLQKGQNHTGAELGPHFVDFTPVLIETSRILRQLPLSLQLEAG